MFRVVVHLGCLAIQLCGAVCALALVGCGTTRTTDTTRTATEQLLISDAIDRAVQEIDFQPLVGQSVFLDDSRLDDIVDRNYLVSTVRQHLLASGCILCDDRAEAEFIVEARVGAIGTDRSDLLFGIPATNVPQILPIQAGPQAIPEVPLAKRRDQRGIAKVSVFAYHRQTGMPVWQSGLAMEESSSNDVWILGAGPFQHGTVYSDPLVAGEKQNGRSKNKSDGKPSPINLAQQATFNPPQSLAQGQQRSPASTGGVAQAAHEQPATPVPSADRRVADAVALPATKSTTTAEQPAASPSASSKDEQQHVASAVDPPSKQYRASNRAAPAEPSNRRAQSTKSAGALSSSDSAADRLPQPRFEAF